MNRYVNLPPTEEGAKMKLTQEMIDNCRLVYEKTDDENIYKFKCIYSPETDYGENCIIAPISSAYKGTEEWAVGQEFANVLKSTGDRNHPVWHTLANENGVAWTEHEEETIYDYLDDRAVQSNYHGVVVGGHVIKGKVPMSLERGSDLYIVPISQRHNSIHLNHINYVVTPGNGNGFYMKMKNIPNRNVLAIKNYLMCTPDMLNENNE